ncbi:MAG: flagellar protein G [Thermoplasmata archaeon]|nr:MAG: flagellar protein G [Thermoplasmata archaeon]RLF35470.1 MAG: flagellar protein G [Thermoplasmata archaeon]
MGFSLTGTHVIFFIASVIIAGAVSGVFIAVINDVSKSFSDRGDRVEEQLDIEFKIINDPDNIPLSTGNYLFYLKNIGGREIATTNQTFNLFIDGEIIATADYNFSDSSIQPDRVTTIYISSSVISSGDHTLKVVGPQAIEDEFTFTI